MSSFLEKLTERHLRDLKFGEVSRALRALSADYVEKRESGGLARALDGRGKRAAFALYYGATHFLAAQALVREFALAFSAAISSTWRSSCPSTDARSSSDRCERSTTRR